METPSVSEDYVAVEGVTPCPEWTPPQFDLMKEPALASTWYTQKQEQNETKPANSNFFRNAKWCPDGSCALATLEDRSIEVVSCVPSGLALHSSFRTSPQASALLECEWYPAASSSHPGLFCYVVSTRDCPIKLLNGSDGRLRASYTIMDHRERFIAPHSFAFDPTATKLYCGCENSIEVFDFNSPGIPGTRIHTTPSKRTKGGLKGIISSLSFSPDYGSGIYAAGSFSGSAALFAVGEEAGMVGKLHGIKGAVTQVQFHPVQSNLILATSRHSGSILMWDIRKTRHVLQEYRRNGKQTNQRMRFDIDRSGQWLATGDKIGNISIYRLDGEDEKAAQEFKAHSDGIGSVSFHPFQPAILSASGSRHYEDGYTSGSDSSTDDTESSDTSERHIRSRARRMPQVNDPSMKLWSFHGPSLEGANMDLQLTT